MNSRIGNTYGNFIKRVCTLGWALTGLLGAALYPGLSTAHREEILGIVTLRLLPHGLAGLMIAAILASVMSSCSGLIVSGAAIAARNLYASGQTSDDKRQLKWGRIATAVITLGALGLAVLLPSVIAGTIRFVTATPFLGVPIWIGVLWRRANRYGAWVSAVGSAVIYYSCDAFGWYFSVCSMLSLLFGIASIIIVSKMTPPEPSEPLEKLFVALHTPVLERAPAVVVCA
jgi:Na+/proline symporter